MSLQTPDAVRTLQRKLYDKATAEPGYRFYLLYDKVWRADILRHAYDRARANDGAPGVDGVTFDQIEAAGLEDWLARLGEELRKRHAHGLAKPVPRDVSVPAGPTGDDPEGRRRGTAARYPDDPGPGGADRGQTGAGTNL
jgi:RNA-directed DNA polymerase